MASFPRPVFLCVLLALASTASATARESISAVLLFNGHDLTGWTVFNDPTKEAATVWTVADGVLRCAGKPRGYLRTQESYRDYRLRLQWRWPDKPGNSGVFVHGSQADKVWPHCYEAQLQAGNAGELRCNGGSRFQPESSPDEKSRPRQGASNERPAGEWNDYEIVCRDGTVTLSINGAQKNVLEKAALTAGWIGLQAEGAPIEFRNIVLEPL